jgi:hypothetical protein
MTNKTTPAASREWPADVLEFAIAHQVDQYLPAVLEMTRQVFPAARDISVRMEEDMEDADDWRILWTIHVPLSWAEYPDYVNRWFTELHKVCPSTHGVWFLPQIEVIE